MFFYLGKPYRLTKEELKESLADLDLDQGHDQEHIDQA